MARILEAVFIIGCSVVGWSMGAPETSGIKQTIGCSVQLVAMAQDNIASNTARLAAHLTSQAIRNLRWQ